MSVYVSQTLSTDICFMQSGSSTRGCSCVAADVGEIIIWMYSLRAPPYGPVCLHDLPPASHRQPLLPCPAKEAPAHESCPLPPRRAGVPARAYRTAAAIRRRSPHSANDNAPSP